MAHGVSPRNDDVKLDGKEDEDTEEFHDMEQDDVTEGAGGAAEEKKAKSTSATAEGQEPKTSQDDETWKTVGKQKKIPIPAIPTKEKMPPPGAFYHVQCRGTRKQLDEAMQILSATQSIALKEVRWCAVLGTPDYPSHRSFAMWLEDCSFVDTAARAHEEHRWVLSAMPEGGLPARLKLCKCGLPPFSWDARRAPAAPEARSHGAAFPTAFPTQAKTAAAVRAAWNLQFPSIPTKQTEQQPQDSKEMDARIKKIEDMVKELLAQGQPSAPAAAPPATQDPELMKRIQDLEDDKAKMAEQLAEVRALVEKQDKVAATQQARYERSNKILVEARMEDAETMTEQQQEIAALKKRLQQQEEKPMFTVVTELVHETTPEADISEATQQVKVTQYDPGAFHTPSPQEKKERQEQEVKRALQSLGRSPKEQNKNIRNKKSRQRQRIFAERVERAGAETAVAPVARRFHSEDSGEDDRWLPVPAGEPVEYLGGGLEGPVGGKRLSDREPGQSGTPEFKGSRLVSAVYADSWQYPQRVENPYGPYPSDSASDCDLEENPDDWGAN
jgi:hypothetical protein